MRKARVGDKVRCQVTEHDVVAGKTYTVTYVATGGVEVTDDVGDDYMLLDNEYTLLCNESPIKDIRGDGICVGDEITYAFAGAQSRHLGLFVVQEISGVTALCRAKADGAVITLGVFEERAIIIK
jgi:hypothetical protein